MSARKQPVLVGIFAHPDDESMATGGTMAKYAALGARTVVLCYTCGAAGLDNGNTPEDPERLCRLRRRELEAAGGILGLSRIIQLDYPDGGLDRENFFALEEDACLAIRQERPDAVIVYHFGGISRHPDHMAASRAALAAVVSAADSRLFPHQLEDGLTPYPTPRLFCFTLPDLPEARGSRPEVVRTPLDEITHAVDTSAYADTKMEAIRAHYTQRASMPIFEEMYARGWMNREYFIQIAPRLPAGPHRDCLLS